MGKKRKAKLGQNFLSDLSARGRIVDALEAVGGATVVEIGPGQGAITDLLVPRAGRVVAVELDRELAPMLRERYAAYPSVTVLEADILEVDLGEVLGDAHERGPVHVVGNLPYYITSDILLGLFRTVRATPGLLTSAVVMMQREVAERVTAQPGSRDFGLLSATAQMHGAAEMLFTLGPEAFSPPPEVDSTVVRIRFGPRFAELGVEPEAFDRFLHHCFAQKRKTLGRNLREAGHGVEAIAAAWPKSVDRMARAEALPVETLAAVFRGLRDMAPAQSDESR